MLAISTIAVEAPFDRVTSGPVGENRAASVGCAWADFDGDGDLDLFVANRDQNSFLYRSNGDGTFTSLHSIVCEGKDAFSGVWADFNNDGYLDLFVGRHTGGWTASSVKNSLFKGLSNGGFAAVGAAEAGEIVNEGGNSLGAAWADYDGDGAVDLFVANWPAMKKYLYRNLGNGAFAKVTEGSIVNEATNSEGASWADYDGDGDPDLFVANGSLANNFLFENMGGGLFEKNTTASVSLEKYSSRGGAWGDYDNDGDLDLYVAHQRAQSLHRNDGSGKFVRMDTVLPAEAAECSGGAWGDYDNDGDLDLFVANGHGLMPQKNFLYENAGDGTFRRITEGAVAVDEENSYSAAWGDYNNDGFLDLFVANGDARPGAIPAVRSALYRNLGNGNSWLKVRCAGWGCNAAGIGTRVEAHTKIHGRDVVQVREISGGVGSYTGGQDGLLAHFGLGDAEFVDLRVIWPCGKTQELVNLPARTELTLREPIDIRAFSAGPDGFRIRIHSGFGRSIRVEASSDFQSWYEVEAVSETEETLWVRESAGAAGSGRFYRVSARF